MPIRVALIGFGRTGTLVAGEIVKDTELELVWVCRNAVPTGQKYASHSLGFDSNFAPFVERDKVNEDFLEQNPVDLIIDFSSGESSSMYDLFSNFGIRIVTAISNYNDQEFSRVISASMNTAILASPNITLGINWLLIASKILKKIIPNSDIEIIEEHFRGKKEVSGTALKIAEHLELDPGQSVNSIRAGGIVGKHEVIFGLPHQTIRITHESVSRSAFGTGAIFAGKWLSSKDKGLYKMEDMMHEKFVNFSQEL